MTGSIVTIINMFTLQNHEKWTLLLSALILPIYRCDKWWRNWCCSEQHYTT